MIVEMIQTLASENSDTHDREIEEVVLIIQESPRKSTHTWEHIYEDHESLSCGQRVWEIKWNK